MMSTYRRQQANLASRDRWVSPSTKGSIQPDPCTLTRVNQTHDLLVSV